MKCENKRNGQIGIVVVNTKEEVIVEVEGQQKSITPSTFKRWWKVLEDTEAQTEQPKEQQIKEELPKEEVVEPKVKKESPKKEVTPSKMLSMVEYIKEQLTKKGYVICYGKAKSWFTVKQTVEQKTRAKMAIGYSKNKITLWVRQCPDNIPHKTVNHSFKYRVELLTTDTEKTCLQIVNTLLGDVK